MTDSKFRYDVNVLRAFAVLSVVIYHFNDRLLPGGFIGVDVFFVISGFLITKIILESVDNNSFSFKLFYLNRANKIIPPLIILCLTLLFFGYFFISPIEYRSLGKHVFSSLSFISNFIFLSESGYFDSSSLHKWLLHTWSLSLEWQFYLIYPLFLILIYKNLPHYKFIFSLILFIGLIFSIFFSSYDANSSYYLLHARYWEFLIGGFICLFPLKINKKYSSAISTICFFTIFFTFLFFDKQMLWPGFYSFIPVISVVILILINNSNYFLNKLEILQFIGKTSYSTYLWHWPIVVLMRKLDYMDYYIYGIFLSFLLGFFSWKFIETKKFFTFSFVKSASGLNYLFFLIIVSLSFYIYMNNGLNQRFIDLNGGNKSPKRHCAVNVGDYKKPSGSCTFFSDNVSWAVIGDSHSIELSYSLASFFKDNNIGIRQFSYQGCFPNFNSLDWNNCTNWYNESIKYIVNDPTIKYVLISHRFSNVFDLKFNNATKNFSDKAIVNASNFIYIVNEFTSHGKHVFILGPIPELKENIAMNMTKNLLNGKDIHNIMGLSKEDYLSQNNLFFSFIDENFSADNVKLIDVTNNFCDSLNCFAVWNGNVLYFDKDHPSLLATDIIVNDFFEPFKVP